MDNMLGNEIGRGGFGVVYANKDDPSECVKVSNKAKGSGNSCRQWSNEYKKITSFMDLVRDHPEYKKLEMVKVVVPSAFVESPERCYMTLPMIFRPEGKTSRKPTIQAQLGWSSGRIVHKGRGEFVGLAEIREYVSQKDMVRACRELGVMMGLIHHVGKNDAYDVELFLGKEAHTKKCRFYLADFDLSEQVKSYDDAATMGRITWSMDAVPYFPRPSCDTVLYDVFRKGYETMTTPEIAARIFENYD